MMRKKGFSFARFIPLILLAIVIFCVFYFKLYQYLSFTQLKMHRNDLLAWTAAHYWLAILVFIVLYIIVVTLSIPGATILTLAGGFFFGVVQGTIYVVVGATLGACLIFLIVKTSLGEALAQKGAKWLNKLKHGFQSNAFSYVLILRLIPIFPFWVINIVAGLLKIPLRSFFIGTLIGIIPGSLVFVSVGNGLGSIFDKGQTPNLSIIFSPQILLPLIGLAVLAFIPTVYKKIKAKKNA